MTTSAPTDDVVVDVPAPRPPPPTMSRFGAPVGAFDPTQHTVPVASHLWLLAWVLVASLGAVVITPPESSLAIWWPATFVGVGLLLQAPASRWLGLTLLLTLMVSLGQVLAGRDVALSTGLGTMTALECLAIVWTLRRLGTGLLTDLRDLTRLLLAGLAGTVVFAVLLLPLMPLLPQSGYLSLLGQVVLSHATAGLCLGPLFLTRPSGHPGRSREQLAQWTVLVALELWVFGTDVGAGMAFALLPVLLWGAVRHSPRAAAIQSTTLAGVAVLLFSIERGPFTVGPDAAYADWPAATTALQLFLSSLALTALVVSVAVQQQRLAAAAARTESAFTRTVLATTDAVTLVVDASGRIELVNGAAERATGYTGEELTGRLLWEALVPTERRDAVRRAFLLADDPADVELDDEEELATRTGRVLRLRMSVSTLDRGDSRPASVVLTGIDVTDERRTSDLLRRMLRASSGTAAIGIELDGTMSIISRGAEEILGLGTAELLGEAFTRSVVQGSCDGEIVVDAGDDPAQQVRRLHRLQGGSADKTASDWWWRCADGRLVAVSQTLDEVLDGSGRPTGFLVFARDVTEERRSQDVLLAALGRERQAVERLRALDLAKSEFVTTVSHELRTPVSSIVGYAELVTESVLDDELTPLVEAISRNGRRLRDLADALVTLSDLDGFATPDAGEAGPVDLRTQLREVVSEHRCPADRRGVRIRLNGTDGGPDDGRLLVAGDAGHLRRAVANVVDNACKFSGDGDLVDVEIECDEQSLVVRVRDEGMGIPADETDQVFQRFYRARNANVHAVQGAGLGLPITETIVRLHGGRVTLASTEGEGTVVELHLPRRRPDTP